MVEKSLRPQPRGRKAAPSHHFPSLLEPLRVVLGCPSQIDHRLSSHARGRRRVEQRTSPVRWMTDGAILTHTVSVQIMA
jgi:hypothetical protein